MSAKYYIGGFTFSLFVILAIVFGCLIPGTEHFYVPGILVSVDSCEHQCWTIPPAGCNYQSYATLQWNYNNESWLANNVSTIGAGCNSCCYNFVNKSVSIGIDRDNPWIVKQFWVAPPPPPSQTFIALTTACALLAFCAATFICATACIDNDPNKNMDTKNLISRGH